MSDLRLRARTPAEIFDAAVTLFRRNASQYMLVAGLALTPLLVLQIATGATGGLTEQGVGSPLGTVVTLLGSVVSYSVVLAFVARFGQDVYLGHPADVQATLREVLPRVPKIVAASLVSGLLITLGALAFLVGAFYFLARTFAVTQLVALEGMSIRGAFRRSAALSLGRKRHILNTLMLSGLVYGAMSFTAAIVGVALKNNVVTLVISTLVSLVAMPTVSLSYLVLYYDTRIRGEGFDLEHLAAGLDPVSPPPHAQTA